jgi:hypothetical protein
MCVPASWATGRVTTAQPSCPAVNSVWPARTRFSVASPPETHAHVFKDPFERAVRDVRASASLHRQRRSRLNVAPAARSARSSPPRRDREQRTALVVCAHPMFPSSIRRRAAASVATALSAALRASSECDAQHRPAQETQAHVPRTMGGGVGVATGTGHRWWIAPTSCARGAAAMSLRVSLRTRQGCDARRARCERTIVVRITRCSGPPLAFRAVELRSGPNVWISEHRDDIDLRRGEAFGIETALRSTARAGVVLVTIERGRRAETIRRSITLR